MKSNEPNPIVIGLIEQEIGKRLLAVMNGTEICKAIDIKLNEPNPSSS